MNSNANLCWALDSQFVHSSAFHYQTNVRSSPAWEHMSLIFLFNVARLKRWLGAPYKQVDCTTHWHLIKITSLSVPDYKVICAIGLFISLLHLLGDVLLLLGADKVSAISIVWSTFNQYIVINLSWVYNDQPFISIYWSTFHQYILINLSSV